MFKFIKSLVGSKQDKDIKKYSPYVEEINEYFEEYKSLSNDELREKTLEFRRRIAEHLEGIDEDIRKTREEANQEGIDLQHKDDLFTEIDGLIKERDKHLEEILLEIRSEAFAVVKETARRFAQSETIEVTATDHDRDLAGNVKKNYLTIKGDKAIWQNKWVAAGGDITWNMVHYNVQLIGGMVLHDGKIAEMATGEGKTLVATLPAYLNGLSQQGVHVITVNDYLARRDCEWVGPIFEFLFLTIDCIDRYKPHSIERKRAYKCDITYGTNNEFGFDYLRDNMVRSKDEKVQAKHHYCMIDEVDSVLVDDARTPLIISGPVPKGTEDQEYISLKPFVDRLLSAQRQLSTKYLTEAKKLFKSGVIGTQEGEAGMPLLRAHRALPKYRPLIKFLSEEGTKVLLQKTEGFYMQEQNKNMHLVDEPLYFTIDEKNRNVELTEKGAEFLAKGNEDANFFIMPDITSMMMEIDADTEMSDAEREEAKLNLSQNYAVKAKRLHSINQLLKAYTLFERDVDYVVIDGQVKIVDEQTGRMMEGRRYSDGLHQALEAKENVKIGDITQTYATITLQNYFRMYHKLAGMTGTAETEAGEFWEIYKLDVVVIPTNKPIVRDDQNDKVYKTEKEKYAAIVNEIVELSQKNRPVLVGTTSVENSERLSRMLKLRKINHNILNAKQHQREAEVVAEAGKPGKVTIATNMAGRGTDIKLTKHVKDLGGLAVISTERHDSRRVDRQLLGRSGRQGDPGSSQFYVSMEDQLMRKFQSDRLIKWMDRLGAAEGDVLTGGLVTRSIENAQKKVEENNFGVRKRLLEYDDVMNKQRENIYRRRNNALFGDRLAVDINKMFSETIIGLVEIHKGNNDYDGFKREVLSVLGIDPKIEQANFTEGDIDELIHHLNDQFQEYYDRKNSNLIAVLLPEIKRIYETPGNTYKRIAIPFTDGRSNPFRISADIEEAVKTNGQSIITDIEQAITLAIIDERWKEHLRSMDELKDSSQAASFEQKDPLVVYKMEAYELFEQLFMLINEEITSYLAKGTMHFSDGRTLDQVREQRSDFSKTQTNRSEQARRRAAEGVSRKPKPQTFKRKEKKIGRNDPCPCGSGKKYKNCHGR